jgi:hypothetical protein
LFIRLLVGSHAGEVHPIAARFHPREAATRLFIARSGNSARGGFGRAAPPRPHKAAAANNRPAMRAPGVDFLSPPS